MAGAERPFLAEQRARAARFATDLPLKLETIVEVEGAEPELLLALNEARQQRCLAGIVEITICLSIYFRLQQHYDRMRDALEEALAASLAIGSSNTAARALLWLAWLDQQDGSLDDSDEKLKSALEAISLNNEHPLQIEIIFSQASVLLRRGNRQEAERRLKYCIRESKKIDDPRLASLAEQGLAGSYSATGRTSEALDLLDAALIDADAAMWDQGRALAKFRIGKILAVRGDKQEALKSYVECLRSGSLPSGRFSLAPSYEAELYYRIAILSRATGDHAQYERTKETARQLCARLGMASEIEELDNF